MPMKKYDVLRDHDGDKPYEEGGVREADPAMVAHLVPKVLVEHDEAAPAPRKRRRKAAPQILNKAAPDAGETKA